MAPPKLGAGQEIAPELQPDDGDDHDENRAAPENEPCPHLAVACVVLQTGCVLRVAALCPSEVEAVDQQLPLNRLDQYAEDGSTYLIAWDDDRPVGHAHIAWQRTHVGVPEIQDVFVVPERRRRGVATTLTRAAEDEVRRRGWDRISLSVSAEGNEPARRLYDGLGYRTTGCAPVRVHGTIMLRGRTVEVNDTLEYLVKPL